MFNYPENGPESIRYFQKDGIELKTPIGFYSNWDNRLIALVRLESVIGFGGSDMGIMRFLWMVG